MLLAPNQGSLQLLINVSRSLSLIFEFYQPFDASEGLDKIVFGEER